MEDMQFLVDFINENKKSGVFFRECLKNAFDMTSFIATMKCKIDKQK